MKRRASIQIVPEKDTIPEYDDPYSTEPEEYTPSKRIIYKTGIIKKIPESEPSKILPKETKCEVTPLSEVPSSYLDLLNSLKAPDYMEKTNKFLQDLNPIEIVTPRKILPNTQSQYKLLCTTECKLYINAVNKGKGSFEFHRSNDGKVILLVFRNCIKKVLFTGLVYKDSQPVIKEKKCKEKHDGKKDVEVVLKQQPGGNKVVCIVCAKDDVAEEFVKCFENVINKR